MTAKQYRQQLNAKWGAIQDAYTRDLIAQLLDYAQNLENANPAINNPKDISYPISPRGDEFSTQTFREQLDFSALPGDVPGSSSDGLEVILEDLLGYTEGLEQQFK